MTRKYFKPKSLTWLASFVPVLAGGLVASLPLHGWSEVVETIDAITGGMSPYVMINAGLVGIGMRGAVE
jgi:hypothetical protein